MQHSLLPVIVCLLTMPFTSGQCVCSGWTWPSAQLPGCPAGAPVTRCTSFTGDVNIQSSTLRNLDFLSEVTTIAGYLVLKTNSQLASVNLTSLKSVVRIEWNNNNALRSLVFPALTTVTENFWLNGNTGLVNISAPVLTTVNQQFMIYFHDALRYVSFPALKRVGGTLGFVANGFPELSLPALQQIGTLHLNDLWLSVLDLPRLASGYSLNNMWLPKVCCNATAYHTSRGTGAPSLPECDAIGPCRCPSLVKPFNPHAVPSSSYLPYSNASAQTIDCDSGYVPSAGLVTCGYRGQWQPRRPVCSPVGCPEYAASCSDANTATSCVTEQMTESGRCCADPRVSKGESCELVARESCTTHGGACGACILGAVGPSCKLCSTLHANCRTCTSASLCTLCSEGFYASNATCKACNTTNGCTGCNGATGACTGGCGAGYGAARDAQGCVACPLGQYATGGSQPCTACGAHCISCNVSTGDCAACMPGYSPAPGAGTDCVPCAAGEYSGGTLACAACAPLSYSLGAAGACLECGANCTSCVASTGVCTSCPAGTMPSLDAGGDCQACASGKYAVAGTSVCSDCQCPECESTTGVCKSCYNGQYLSDGQCRDCAPGCATCSEADLCLSCSSGALNPNSLCCAASAPCAELGRLACNVSGSPCGALEHPEVLPIPPGATRISLVAKLNTTLFLADLEVQKSAVANLLVAITGVARIRIVIHNDLEFYSDGETRAVVDFLPGEVTEVTPAAAFNKLEAANMKPTVMGTGPSALPPGGLSHLIVTGIIVGGVIVGVMAIGIAIVCCVKQRRKRAVPVYQYHTHHTYLVAVATSGLQGEGETEEADATSQPLHAPDGPSECEIARPKTACTVAWT